MKQVMDSECPMLKTALSEFENISQKIAPLLKEQADKKQALIDALGRVIIHVVEEHGTIEKSQDKTWYRMMQCTRGAGMPGFEELINTMFGQIDWTLFYKLALENLDQTKACFISGQGDCFVVLCEKLTSADVKVIRRSRRTR